MYSEGRSGDWSDEPIQHELLTVDFLNHSNTDSCCSYPHYRQHRCCILVSYDNYNSISKPYGVIKDDIRRLRSAGQLYSLLEKQGRVQLQASFCYAAV